MSNPDQDITDRTEIDAVIHESKVCRVGLCDNGSPYVVPMCFGYDGEAVFLHSGPKGRKLDILRKNPAVCIEFDLTGDVEPAPKACGWGIGYRSVIVQGTAEFVEDADAQRTALRAIMAQYSNKSFTFPDAAVQGTCIIKVPVETVTGKRSG